MLQILQHIEPLLQNHDFVVIPSLGGFVASMQGAKCQEDTIYPPCKAVGFNPTLTYNDGLLAQAIAQESGCTIHKANNLVEQEVEALKIYLLRFKQISIGKLGILKQSDNGIDFEPAKQGITTATSYGLQPVFFPQVTCAKTIIKPLVQPQTITKQAPQSSIRFAVACVAAILILLMIPINFNQKQHISRAMFVPPVAFEEVVITPQIQLNAAEECTPYHVVIGSFNTQAKAIKFINELPSSLKDSKIVYSEHRFRIIAASYPTEELGNQGMEQIAKKHPAYKDAWLLHYNP